MEYADGGNLEAYVQKNGPLSEVKARKMMQLIVQGVAYLHDHNIVHRDLKLSNILMDNKTKRVLLTDFGVATRTR